jgi:hypothetical protein
MPTKNWNSLKDWSKWIVGFPDRGRQAEFLTARASEWENAQGIVTFVRVPSGTRLVKRSLDAATDDYWVVAIRARQVPGSAQPATGLRIRWLVAGNGVESEDFVEVPIESDWKVTILRLRELRPWPNGHILRHITLEAYGPEYSAVDVDFFRLGY